MFFEKARLVAVQRGKNWRAEGGSGEVNRMNVLMNDTSVPYYELLIDDSRSMRINGKPMRPSDASGVAKDSGRGGSKISRRNTDFPELRAGERVPEIRGRSEGSKSRKTRASTEHVSSKNSGAI